MCYNPKKHVSPSNQSKQVSEPLQYGSTRWKLKIVETSVSRRQIYLLSRVFVLLLRRVEELRILIQYLPFPRIHINALRRTQVYLLYWESCKMIIDEFYLHPHNLLRWSRQNIRCIQRPITACANKTKMCAGRLHHSLEINVRRTSSSHDEIDQMNVNSSCIRET